MLEEERFVVFRSTVLLLGHFLSKLQLASLIMHIHWMTKSLGWLWPWNLTTLYLNVTIVLSLKRDDTKGL